ncbi:MAG: ABC transporter permease [Armatimonadetes bacterium]|nr:ABC transporter permease [Armatimonadota bacterium]
MPEYYLLLNALRDLMRPRRMLVGLTLVLLPALIALFFKRFAGDEFSVSDGYHAIVISLIQGFVLVITAVVNGCGTVSQELEQKTIVYLLTRPLPRWRLLLTRYIAAVVGSSAVTALSILLLALVLFGGGAFGHTQIWLDLAIIPVGAMAYAGVFMFVATIIPRPLIVGLLFIFGWESWAPTLPGNFGKLALVGYVRRLAPHPEVEMDSQDIREFLAAISPAVISRREAWIVLTVVILLSVIASLIVFSYKEYVPKEDAE